MNERRKKILRAIISKFIETAQPISSQFLTEVFKFSSATIRNEMRNLEERGFLRAPHTSAGRAPTDRGFRFFVEEISTTGILEKMRPTAMRNFEKTKIEYFAQKKADEKVFDAISILSRMVENVAFATIPSQKYTFYLGISKMLSQPEFHAAPESATKIFRILEENFFEFLESLNLQTQMQIFIGDENILPEIRSCALLVGKFKVLQKRGFIGILGPQRMDFAKNILALENCLQFLKS